MFSQCKADRIALDNRVWRPAPSDAVSRRTPVRRVAGQGEGGKGTTMDFITIATEEFPGSRACALTVRSSRGSANCVRFTVYTDDLPGLREYVEAHNAGNGEFKLDLSRVGAGRARNGRPTPAHFSPSPFSSSSIRSRCRSGSRRRRGRGRETCFGYA